MKFTPQSDLVQNVKQSSKGVEYVEPRNLKISKKRITRAHFWRIPHDSGVREISLKIGRYTYNMFCEEVEVKSPKSELTLDDAELKELIIYLQENYEPLRDGATQYIAVNGELNSKVGNQLKAFFSNPDKSQLLQIITENEILPADLLTGLEMKKRLDAVYQFESLLDSSASENTWQKWFQENCWVLGSEFVRILDDRKIDTANVADFLVQAYDGFLDIIEIKKPETDQRFWANAKYRDNLIPSQELVGTIMQATNYIHEVEQEANSAKFLERMGHIRVVKPRGVLIYGRSNDWTNEHRKAFRLLNANYHNLTIMTYDQVLLRAKRVLGVDQNAPASQKALLDDEIPF